MIQDTGYKIQNVRFKTKNITHHASCIVHRASCKAGVTLVELLIVIAIIGIIVLFATIDTGWFQRDARVTEARDRLLADIEDAKLKSLAKVPHGIIVATTSYRMVCLKEGNCSVTTTTACCQDSDCPSGESCTFPAAVNFKKDTGQTCPTACSDIPNSSVILSTNVEVGLTSGTELWFDRKGVPRTTIWGINGNTFRVWYDNGDNILSWTDSNGSGSLDLESECGEPCKLIILSDTGRIQYEKR